jgi:plastocyanin
VASRTVGVVLVTAALAFSAAVRADPVTSTSPNIDTPEVIAPRTVDFLFFHRFDAVSSKLLNSPTFSLTIGVVDRLSVGVLYASSSNVGSGPNETQPILRFAALRQAQAAPLDLTAELAYNVAAESVDGALVGARRLGPVSLLATARGFSETYVTGGTGFAGGLGATLQLTRYLFLTGDLNRLIAVAHSSQLAPPVFRLGWSGGISFKIPYSPHAFSFYATNVNTVTLQGSSRGTDVIRYGFAFDVPFTDLDRWIEIFRPKAAGAPSPAPAAAAAQPAAPSGPAGQAGRVVEVAIQGNGYHPEQVTIRPGDTVRWVNHDPVRHTVTERAGSWTSPLLDQGQKYERRFDAAGRTDYTCTIHPFMHGTVVVGE